jgi:hypothetical protein
MIVLAEATTTAQVLDKGPSGPAAAFADFVAYYEGVKDKVVAWSSVAYAAAAAAAPAQGRSRKRRLHGTSIIAHLATVVVGGGGGGGGGSGGGGGDDDGAGDDSDGDDGDDESGHKLRRQKRPRRAATKAAAGPDRPVLGGPEGGNFRRVGDAWGGGGGRGREQHQLPPPPAVFSENPRFLPCVWYGCDGRHRRPPA